MHPWFSTVSCSSNFGHSITFSIFHEFYFDLSADRDTFLLLIQTQSSLVLSPQYENSSREIVTLHTTTSSCW